MRAIRLYHVAFLTAVAAVVLAGSAEAAAPKGDVKPRYEAQYAAVLKNRGPQGVAERLLSTVSDDTATAEIEGLAAVLAESPKDALAVLDALAAKRSAEAATLQAELLYQIAVRGDVKLKVLLTDDLADRGAALLAHDDPCVRGIAEWALAVRVGADNLPRKFDYVWPKPNPPAWFARWFAQKPETFIECDYVRQLACLGMHRTRAGLLNAADDVLRRAAGLAADIQIRGSAERRRLAAAALATVTAAHGRLVEFAKAAPGDLTGQRKRWLELRLAAREVVLAGPDADFKQVVFLTCSSDHSYVQHHGQPGRQRAGGDIFVQTGLTPASPQRPLIADRLGSGNVQDMDLWWDADRLVFAYTRRPRGGERGHGLFHGVKNGVFLMNGSEPTHLYEISLDGSNLRQLTDDPKRYDVEPAYLPNGDIVFSSDRWGGSSQCGMPGYSALPNLYRLRLDGKRIERLTYNKDVDRYPHCLNNGLIGYMRWDYQERMWGSPHALWTIRPDGTGNDGLFKTHAPSPASVREPRPIPGSDKLAVIACGHHNPPEGAVALVDCGAGVNNLQGMHYVTPSSGPMEGGFGPSPAVPEGGVRDGGGYYKTPWPLSEKGFLVSYAYGRPERTAYAAYYIDVWGNKELLHRDLILDTICPMPVVKRPRPPMLPENTNPDLNYALCYLDDVYRDMRGIERGTIKHLRIAEQTQWFENKDNVGSVTWSPGPIQNSSFSHWTWSPVRVVGTVPVEKDGSAYFKVPVGLPVYFQALDENRMEVRRMRSHIEFKPGEQRGCVGCHETKEHVARTTFGRPAMSLAMNREPSLPVPPPWGDVAILDYENMIQPIFEKRCVRCHGAKEPKGDLDLTADRPFPEDSRQFMQSYRSLFGIRPDRKTPAGGVDRGAFPELRDWPQDSAVWRNLTKPGNLLCLCSPTSGVEVSKPKEFGSHQSRLVLTLLNDPLHKQESPLSSVEWETLVTWVDANAPYFSTFYQFFSPTDGKRLPRPIRIHVELSPPFVPGEKTHKIYAQEPPKPAQTAAAGR